MQQPNENGVYEPEIVAEVARRGRAYASVEIAECQDGLYRYALSMMYSTGGFGEPITDHGKGWNSAQAAKEAGIVDLLKRWPKGWPSDPQSMHDELREMKASVEAVFSQPTLF